MLQNTDGEREVRDAGSVVNMLQSDLNVVEVIESLGNWVAEFDYSRLSSQVSSLSGYQAGMFDGEDAVWVVQFLVSLPW